MRKLIGIVLLTATIVTMLSGCGRPDPAEVQDALLEMLDEPATEESVSRVGDYLDENIRVLAQEDADQMVIEYESYIFSYDSNQLIYRDFLERYGKYISEPLGRLYEIKIEEQEEPMAVDTVLQRSFRQICDRALLLELYIKENKSVQAVQEDSVWIYTNYINAMLMGTTGTPIFSYQDGAFSEEAKEAYIAFSAEYPDTTVTWVLNEYFAYLDSVKFELKYQDATESTVFFETCSYLVKEAGKRVTQ